MVGVLTVFAAGGKIPVKLRFLTPTGHVEIAPPQVSVTPPRKQRSVIDLWARWMFSLNTLCCSWGGHSQFPPTTLDTCDLAVFDFLNLPGANALPL